MSELAPPRPQELGLGQWWVVDVQIPGEHVVLIGPRTDRGRSLRRVLRGTPGRVLPRAINEVLRSGAVYEEVSEPIQHVRHQVTVVPVPGPDASVHAVLCCVCPLGQDLPDPPLVGGWEWDIAARTGRGTAALYDMFDTPQEMRGGAHGMAQYLGRTSLASNPRALRLWERAAAATDEDLLCETVEREREGTTRRYAVWGRPLFGESAEPVMFTGVTIDVTDQPLETAHNPIADLLEAVLGVLDHGELALAVVDVTHRQIVRWLTAPLPGVAWPPDAYLGELVHPEDRAELGRVWAEVGGLSVGEGVRTRLRLPGTDGDGDWVRVGFEARHYRHTDTARRLLLAVHVDPD